jgi:hypothetical protein
MPVLSVALSRVSQPVYNIETHGEHVYQVGELGVLVHNVKGGLVPTGAKRLGKWGEDRLEALLGGAGIRPKNLFFTSMGTRYVDRLINGLAHESKAGVNFKLTNSIWTQILKDKERIDEGLIKGAHWHFWQGVSKELRRSFLKHSRRMELGIRCIDMRFDLFEKMSAVEAEDVLNDFLGTGKRYEADLGLNVDYSLSTLPTILEDLTTKLTSTPTQEDLSLPEFIRNTEDYKVGLYEFTPEAKRTIIGAAYHFGECFLRLHSRLKWGVGKVGYATGNMPVVVGFDKGKELPVLLVLENLFSRRIENPDIPDVFQTAIEKWMRNVS